jgi:hypothetical protein
VAVSARVTIALVVFFAVVAIGFPAPEFRERFFRLALALVVGALVMLVTDRACSPRGDGRPVLPGRVVDGGGDGRVGGVDVVAGGGGVRRGPPSTVNDIPGVFRVLKPAYLETGFLAVTNWHQDPGFGAAWAVLWSMLVLVASVRGSGCETVVGRLDWCSVAWRCGW